MAKQKPLSGARAAARTKLDHLRFWGRAGAQSGLAVLRAFVALLWRRRRRRRHANNLAAWRALESKVFLSLDLACRCVATKPEQGKRASEQEDSAQRGAAMMNRFV